MQTTRAWPSLLGFIALVAVVSALGGWVTSTSVNTWYAELAKAEWRPPNALFGPVWTALYAMMAVVGWKLWRARTSSPAARSLLVLWAVQLVLNSAWSFLFFGLRSPLAGLLDIVPLLVVVLWIQIGLFKWDRVLGVLWVPYVLWLSFATALNFSIWHLQN